MNIIEIKREQSNKTLFPLPEDPLLHLNDFNARLAHQEIGEKIAPLSPKSVGNSRVSAEIIYERSGKVGTIVEIDEANGQVKIECVCGALFVASLNDFSPWTTKIAKRLQI